MLLLPSLVICLLPLKTLAVYRVTREVVFEDNCQRRERIFFFRKQIQRCDRRCRPLQRAVVTTTPVDNGVFCLMTANCTHIVSVTRSRFCDVTVTTMSLSYTKGRTESRLDGPSFLPFLNWLDVVWVLFLFFRENPGTCWVGCSFPFSSSSPSVVSRSTWACSIG